MFVKVMSFRVKHIKTVELKVISLATGQFPKRLPLLEHMMILCQVIKWPAPKILERGLSIKYFYLEKCKALKSYMFPKIQFLPMGQFPGNYRLNLVLS